MVIEAIAELTRGVKPSVETYFHIVNLEVLIKLL